MSDVDQSFAEAKAGLQELSLFPAQGDEQKTEGFVSAFTGPPLSAASIESGMTAATKWWSAGGGATVAGIWAGVYNWWGSQAQNIQIAALGGAFLVTAAAVLAIGYMIAADVRARAEAAAATIDARVRVAEAVLAVRPTEGRLPPGVSVLHDGQGRYFVQRNGNVVPFPNLPA